MVSTRPVARFVITIGKCVSFRMSSTMASASIALSRLCRVTPSLVSMEIENTDCLPHRSHHGREDWRERAQLGRWASFDSRPPNLGLEGETPSSHNASMEYTKPKTTFGMVQLKTGSGWHIRATLPHGERVQVNYFKTELEAIEWIADKSTPWLKIYRGGRYA